MSKEIKPILFELLACPQCKTRIIPDSPFAEFVICPNCSTRYPIIDGVPIMMPQGLHIELTPTVLVHEYAPWIVGPVMKSMGNDYIFMDCGSGNVTLNLPNLIRMDVGLGPNVDLVGDCLALPISSNSVDFIFSMAVLEHLRNPFLAAQEMYRVCKAGGYTYVETNFVFPFHGIPDHFFNTSPSGIREAFRNFTEVSSGVAPHQMPSYAIGYLLKLYHDALPTNNKSSAHLKSKIRSLLSWNLRKFDALLSQEDARTIAAAVYFYGIKQSFPEETVLPANLIKHYKQDSNLQRLFPQPFDISTYPNLMSWGRENHLIKGPAIDINAELEHYKQWLHNVREEWYYFQTPLLDIPRRSQQILCEKGLTFFLVHAIRFLKCHMGFK